MSEQIHKTLRLALGVLITGLLLCSFPSNLMAKQATIKEIRIQQRPYSVKFFISDTIPVKVIQLEKQELLVALKNVTFEKGFTIKGRDRLSIKEVAIEKLPGNVVAVILTSAMPYESVRSGFNPLDSSFTISLEKQKKLPDSVSKSPVAVTPKQDTTAQSNNEIKKTKNTPDEQKALPASPSKSAQPAQPKKIAPPTAKPTPSPEPTPNTNTEINETEKIMSATVSIPSKREQSKFKGDISDLVTIIDASECESVPLTNSILLLKKGLFKEAFDVLDQYIFQENFTCLEEAYFLRAHAFLRSLDSGRIDFDQMIMAERNFQDALVAYPQSKYVPFGYSAIGIIQLKLKNISAAEGYFNIVKQAYLAYPGLPEVMYYLAGIYDEKGFLDKSLRYFKQVFEDKVQNNYIADAGIGYGKALYKKRQYINSLAVLDYVVKIAPKKIYTTHEILLHIGNANFEIGENKAARENLSRLLNLYPEIENRDVILSKIGDTYGMENNIEKAIKIYELVREKYPDSEGYIASSIGIARYLKSDKEKIDIYQMIKTKFPENSFSRIAMMRLAEIYKANGEYNKCIKEIEDLLSTHPRGLRYEAVKLMQQAYEALFKQQLKSDEYTNILNRYELEHTRIDRMDSRQIELQVGLSYLKANLYEEAFNHLIMAYKQYKRSDRSSELLFGLGVAMDESNRDDDALKLFNAFTKRFTKSKRLVEVYSRVGDIYLKKSKFELSSQNFSAAYKRAESHYDKGRILNRHANVYDKKEDLNRAANLRENAIKEIALASGENYGILVDSYKQLGRTYISLKQYVDAADSFFKALRFSESDQEKANIGFLLGDAYQKGNILTKAKEAYEQVAASYDSVWARLAQQRLNTIELAQTVQSS